MTPSGKYLPARIWPVVAFCCVLSLLITGCTGGLGLPAAQAAPEPCTLDEMSAYAGNTYPQLQGEDVKNVVEAIHIFTMKNLSDINKINIAKREALRLLENQTKRWSAVQYISVAEQPRARVIMTFLTPGLIRAIILNQWLATLNPAQPADMLKNVTDNLAKFDARKDLAFLLLVQTESQAGKTITLAPGGIAMSNSTGVTVNPKQIDKFLEFPLDSVAGKQSGFVFYPSGRKDNQTCSPILDLNVGTSLILKIDTVNLNDKSAGPYVWTLYFPLLEPFDNASLLIPDLTTYVQYGEDANESTLREPPSSSFVATADTIQWRDVGRFIWWRIMTDSTLP